LLFIINIVITIVIVVMLDIIHIIKFGSPNIV